MRVPGYVLGHYVYPLRFFTENVLLKVVDKENREHNRVQVLLQEQKETTLFLEALQVFEAISDKIPYFFTAGAVWINHVLICVSTLELKQYFIRRMHRRFLFAINTSALVQVPGHSPGIQIFPYVREVAITTSL